MECTGTRFRKYGFEFPCGQCFVCRLRMQRTWVARILLEQAVHKESCFVTLTYDEEHSPADGCVSLRDVQLFVKRLRKVLPPRSVRYLAVGEYGEKSWRPHYHMALFGCSDPQVVAKAWGKGFTLVKGIGPESAAYIVSYVLKRRNNEERSEGRSPEFRVQSLRPAIGLRASQRLVIPCGTEVQGVRIGNRIYPLGRYLRAQLRLATLGGSSVEATALRHRVAKYALQVRDSVDHSRKVENAKTITKAAANRRREKQGL